MDKVHPDPRVRLYCLMTGIAVHVQEGKVINIQIVTEITDYDQMFNHSIQKDVEGNNMYL